MNEFHQACDFKFSHIPKIRIYNFGLSNVNKPSMIYILNDASSTTPTEDAVPEIIEMRDVIDTIKQLNIESIDLIKINIEGEEYDLLERLISEGSIINKIKNIQVQYHTFISDAEERREKINNFLQKTHECTWKYEWVWENWKLK